MPTNGITFITVTYNSANFIKECFDSILKTAKSNIEIIVIDNFSSDKSVDVVENIKLYDNRINLIKNRKNEGLCKALNQGLKLANYDIVVTINPDIVLNKNYIDTIMNQFSIDSDLGICYCWINYLDTNKTYSKGVVLRSDFKFLNLGRNIIEDIPIVSGNGACIAYKRLDINKVGGFDEDFFMFNEEVEISLKIQNSGKKIKVIEEVLIEHFHCHSYDNRDIKFTFLYNINALRIALKYYPWRFFRKGIILYFCSFFIDIFFRPHIVSFKSIPFILKQILNLLLMLIPYIIYRKKNVLKFDIHNSPTTLKKLLNYKYGKKI